MSRLSNMSKAPTTNLFIHSDYEPCRDPGKLARWAEINRKMAEAQAVEAALVAAEAKALQ